jgi:uncharacterized membrane protein
MRTKEFLGRLEHERIAGAIAEAESKTSGEIRVFLARGHVVDVFQEARKWFERLGMTSTKHRNGVLILVAPRARKFAVIGDSGIHERCGDEFWNNLVEEMRQHFQRENFTDGIVHAIEVAGSALSRYFPREPGDRNELPDTIEEG